MNSFLKRVSHSKEEARMHSRPTVLVIGAGLAMVLLSARLTVERILQEMAIQRDVPAIYLGRAATAVR